jgi:hypothetical protein
VAVQSLKYNGLNRGNDKVGTTNIKLLKPHGSLNWYAKSYSWNLEKVLASRGISQVIVSPIPPANEKPRMRLTRLFIPPLYTKFFSNRLWRKLWTEVYRQIKQTERIVVVGCSLIETDFHLRSIIAKALSDRKKKLKEIVIAVPSSPNPEYDVQKKLKRFFRGRSTCGIKTYENFTVFIKHV